MSLDRRLRQAFRASTNGIDEPSVERELHMLLKQGRRSRRNRRVVAAIAVLALILGVVFLFPRALDALRSVGKPRPATPPRPEGIPGMITTVAGTGEGASRGDGGPATAAAVRYPLDLVADEAGNLYILEASGRVRKVDSAGRITTVVGPPATRADTALTEANELRLGANALAIDREGNLYVGGGHGNSNHFVVSRISPLGQVTRVAGTGRPGFSGDGGPAIEAKLGWVYDLAVDEAGNIFIVDKDNNRIRMVDTDGVITTIAGTGEPGFSGDGGPATEAQINPYGIALDGEGNIYVTSQPGVVRRIDTSGVITTIAGSGTVGYAGDGGPATAARLSTGPEHVEVDQDGRVYIEDTGNHCIRMVDLDGTITTIVGVGKPGFLGDGGPARSALLRQPSGMLLTPDGVLFIADSANHRVRRVIV